MGKISYLESEPENICTLYDLAYYLENLQII